MKKSVNQRMADEQVRRKLYVHRFSTKLANDARARVLKARLMLAMKVQESLEAGPPNPQGFTQTHLVAMIRNLTRTVTEMYTAVMDDATKALAGYAAVEAAAQTSLFESLIPAIVQQFFPVQRVTTAQIIAAALEQPMQGALLKDWAKKQSESAIASIANQIQQGYLLGESHQQIVKRVTGTKDEPGLMGRMAADAGNVVKTAVGHYQAAATDLMGKANEDLIKAQQWLSTLDSHTSKMCQIRDHLLYTMDKAPQPIKHSIPWGAGPGKLHFCCRSTKTFVIKSWQELGIKAGELDAGTRASMNGQVPADMDFVSWVGRQDALTLNDLYGVQRSDLIQQGKLKPSDMFNDKGEYLTLKELAEKGLIKTSGE